MLIPCPECQRPVSDRARACPGCGFPVAEALQSSGPESQEQSVPIPPELPPSVDENSSGDDPSTLAIGNEQPSNDSLPESESDSTQCEVPPEIPRAIPKALPTPLRLRRGEVDCPKCQARGFVLHIRRTDPSDPNSSTTEHFDWCEYCEHTGRQILVESEGGYCAVPRVLVDDFLDEAIDIDHPDITVLGEELPESHRYDQAGPSYRQADSNS